MLWMDSSMNTVNEAADQESPFVTGAELQKRWKVSQMYLFRLRAAGRLSVMRIGKRAIRYSLEDVRRIEAESVAK